MSTDTLRRLGVATGVAGLLVGASIGLYSRYVHPYRPRVNHIILPLPRTAAYLDGLSIAFVTDFHVGPHFSAKDIDPVIEIVANAEPDIVLFGGDYICESPRFFDHVQPVLTAIAEQATLGSWGIWGNHDLANIRARAETMIANTGITMLCNESVEVKTDAGSLWIVGVDDALLGKPDLDGAWSGVPADAPVIALWHEPDVAPRLAPYAPLAMLAGHSHGGQVRVPMLGNISAPEGGQKYVSGRYDVDGMPLYVSNGIGMYRPPVRFHCPAEVLIFHLTA